MMMTQMKLPLFTLLMVFVLLFIKEGVKSASHQQRKPTGHIKTAVDKSKEPISDGASSDGSYVEYVDGGPLGMLYDFLISNKLQRFCKLLRKANIDDILVELGIFTIFAPTDGSFAFLPGGKLDELENNPNLLREFILYHIVEGDLQTTSINDELVVESLQQQPLRFNIYGPAQNVITVSGAEILERDLKFDIGRIHIIDRPLYPYPETDIVTYLRKNYRQFYDLIVRAGLESYLSGGTFTAFVPDEKAFEYLSIDLKDALRVNDSLAYRIVLNHVLPATFFVRGLQSGSQMQSVEGGNMVFSERRGLTFINGVPVVISDIPMTNGVIHIINRVILPDGIESDCHCKPLSSSWPEETSQRRTTPGRSRTTQRPVQINEITPVPQRRQGPGTRQRVTPKPISRSTFQQIPGRRISTTPSPIIRSSISHGPHFVTRQTSRTTPSTIVGQRTTPKPYPQRQPVAQNFDRVKTATRPVESGGHRDLPPITTHRQTPGTQDAALCRKPDERPSLHDRRPLCSTADILPPIEPQEPDIRYPQRPSGQTRPVTGSRISQPPIITPPVTPSISNVFDCKMPGERFIPGDRRPLCSQGATQSSFLPPGIQTPVPEHPRLQRPETPAQPIKTKKPGKQKPEYQTTVQSNCRRPEERLITGDRRPLCTQSQGSLPDCRSSSERPIPGDRRPLCQSDEIQQPNCRNIDEHALPGDRRPLCKTELTDSFGCRQPNDAITPGDRRPLCPEPQLPNQGCRMPWENAAPHDRRPICPQSTTSNCRLPGEQAAPGDRRPYCQSDEVITDCRRPGEITTFNDRRPLCPSEPNLSCRPPGVRPEPGDRRPICPSGQISTFGCRSPSERALPGDRRPLCPSQQTVTSECRLPGVRALPGDRRPLCPSQPTVTSECRLLGERALPGDRRPLCPSQQTVSSECRPPEEQPTLGDRRPPCQQEFTSDCRQFDEQRMPGDNRPLCKADDVATINCRPVSEPFQSGDMRPPCIPSHIPDQTCRQSGEQIRPGDTRPLCPHSQIPDQNCRPLSEPIRPGDRRPSCPPSQTPGQNCRPLGEPIRSGDRRPPCPPSQISGQNCRLPGELRIPGDRRPICQTSIPDVQGCRLPSERSSPGDRRPLCQSAQTTISDCRTSGDNSIPGDTRPFCSPGISVPSCRKFNEPLLPGDRRPICAAEEVPNCRMPGEPFTSTDRRPLCSISSGITPPSSQTRTFAQSSRSPHLPRITPSFPSGRPPIRTQPNPPHSQQVPQDQFGRHPSPTDFPSFASSPSIDDNFVDGYTEYNPEDFGPSIQRPGKPPRLQPPNQISSQRPGQPPRRRPSPNQISGESPRRQTPSQIRPGLPSRSQVSSQRPYQPAPTLPPRRTITTSRISYSPPPEITVSPPIKVSGIPSASQFTTRAPLFPPRRPGSQSSHATKGQPYDPSRHPPRRRPTGRFTPQSIPSWNSSPSRNNRVTSSNARETPLNSPRESRNTIRNGHNSNNQNPPNCRRISDPVTPLTQSLPLCPTAGNNAECQRADQPYNPSDPRPICESSVDEDFYADCRNPAAPYDPADTRPPCYDINENNCRQPNEPFNPTDYRPLCELNNNTQQTINIRPPSPHNIRTNGVNSPQSTRPQSGVRPNMPPVRNCRQPGERTTRNDRRPLCSSNMSPQRPLHSQNTRNPNVPNSATESSHGQTGNSPVNNITPSITLLGTNQGTDNHRNIPGQQQPLQPINGITHITNQQQHSTISEITGNQRNTLTWEGHFSTTSKDDIENSSDENAKLNPSSPNSAQTNRQPQHHQRQTTTQHSSQTHRQTQQHQTTSPPHSPQTHRQPQHQTTPHRTTLHRTTPHRIPPISSGFTPSIESKTTISDDSPRTLYQIVENPALLIRGHPVQLTKIFELFQKAGLEYILTDPSPHTVFLPSDDAFLRLPKGAIEQLENNPELLRQVLLYHISPTEVLPGNDESYAIPSLQGNQILITMLNGGRLILISGAKAVAVTKARNGIFYVINELLYPLPQDDIVSALHSRPDLSQVTSYISQSGLQDMFQGNQPYTLFAPSDNAFIGLPDPILKQLSENVTALQDLLKGHIIEGAHYGREFLTGANYPNLQGNPMDLKVVSFGYQVNGVNIKTPEIVTGTGVIHVIDEVLLSPEFQILIDGQQNSLEGVVASEITQPPSRSANIIGGTHSSLSAGYQINSMNGKPNSQGTRQITNTQTSHHSSFTRRGSVVFEFGTTSAGQGNILSNHKLSAIQQNFSSEQDFAAPKNNHPNSPNNPNTSGSHSGYGTTLIFYENPKQESLDYKSESPVSDFSSGSRSSTYSFSVSSDYGSQRSEQPSPLNGRNTLPLSHRNINSHDESLISDQKLLNPSEHYSGVAQEASEIGLSQFASLLTKTGISDKVQDGGSYTVFAPTNEALKSLSNLSPNELKVVLLYHIIPQKLGSRSIQNDETASTLLEGKKIRFNVYRDGHVMTALGIPIEQPQNSGTSVNLVPVNRVLLPPEGNLLKVIESIPNLQEFTKAIKDSRLNWMLSSEGSWTLFAPSDAAFQSLSNEERKNIIENRQAFTDLLKRHLMRGTLFTTGLQDGTQKVTESRKTVTFAVNNGVTTINSVPISYSDVPATNGVLHIIDQFL